MDTQELWETALGELELQLSKANFTTWFKDTFISEISNDRIVIAVPNNFTKAWLESKYHKDILKSLQRVTSDAVREVNYKVEVQSASSGPQSIPVQEVPSFDQNKGFQLEGDAKTNSSGDTLNPRYTFETYIVGKQNEFAHAAAMAIPKNLGTTYNPLFIYGGVGLGKTHLLQAIGHDVVRQHQGKRVMYVTSEKFTNDFINAVRTGRAREFKDVYRTVDVLILDDIQFFSGKVETQEEFFHTFNALHQQNKQIILSADRPPKAIAALENRLLSRFEWGMTADISSPDFETRVAILESKCRERQWTMKSDVVHFVAENISSNVRELEGALNKIIAYHQLKNQAPSIESIEPIIQSFKPVDIIKTVTPRELMNVVAEYFDITNDEIVGKSREKRLAFPRQIIMYLMREEMAFSYPSIGAELGGRDHTTAMHAYSKIKKLFETDEKLKHDIEIIKQRMYTS
ncbi:chromosomal replication initiator protein DnaA [Candidatus Uhrbacteria bacterium]|jgi:chromosomal replication initiator protein|nr:chromosomal replication initiator protein DnaA [Candidatus Uhrbacteria bacterium]